MVRNKNATFLVPMGVFFVRAAASGSNDPSSFGIRIGGGGFGFRDKRVSPAARVVVLAVVAAGLLIVKIMAKGKQRSKAQNKESGDGDSIFFFLFKNLSVEYGEKVREIESKI